MVPFMLEMIFISSWRNSECMFLPMSMSSLSLSLSPSLSVCMKWQSSSESRPLPYHLQALWPRSENQCQSLVLSPDCTLESPLGALTIKHKSWTLPTEIWFCRFKTRSNHQIFFRITPQMIWRCCCPTNKLSKLQLPHVIKNAYHCPLCGVKWDNVCKVFLVQSVGHNLVSVSSINN